MLDPLVADLLKGAAGGAIALTGRHVIKWWNRPLLQVESGQGEEFYVNHEREKTYGGANGSVSSTVRAFRVGRVKVTNIGRTTAAQCRGYLLHLEMETRSGERATIIRDTIPLRWSYTDEQHRGKDLFSGVPHYLDLIESKEGNSATGLCTMPRFPNFLNILQPPHLYRFVVQVVGENVKKPVVIPMCFRWHGDWRTYALWREGEEEPNTPLLLPESLFRAERVSPDAEK